YCVCLSQRRRAPARPGNSWRSCRWFRSAWYRTSAWPWPHSTNRGSADVSYRSLSADVSYRSPSADVSYRSLSAIEVGQARDDASALEHRLAVVRVGDLRALLQPVLLQHRAIEDVDAVADGGVRRFRVADDRVAQPAERVARRLHVGDAGELRRRGVDGAARLAELRGLRPDGERRGADAGHAVAAQRLLHAQVLIDDRGPRGRRCLYRGRRRRGAR